MWKAILENVMEAPVANDTVDITIRFENSATGKTFSKGYNIHADSLKDAAAVRSLAQAELDKLAKFDTAVTALKSFVGKEIK